MIDKPMRLILEAFPGEVPRDANIVGTAGPELVCRVTIEDAHTNECVYVVLNPFPVGAHIARDLRAGIIGTAEMAVASIARDLTEQP